MCYDGLFDAGIGEINAFSDIPFLLVSRIRSLRELIANVCRSPIIIFTAFCLIAGFAMLDLPSQITVHYIGTYVATGAYISNWATLNAYQSNNTTGQWKCATAAAAV
jgi:hypothetical protein